MAALVMFSAHAVNAASPTFDVSGQTSRLLASAMQVTQFSYAGTSTFSDGSGASVTALEFTLASATGITALKSFVPCHDVGDGLQLIYVVEAGGAELSGGIELFATEVKYTDGSGAHDWTVASPPPSVGLLDDGVTITDVDVAALATSIPSITTTAQRTYAAFCGTAAPATPTRAPATQTPTPSPSVPASPTDSATPTPDSAPTASPVPPPTPPTFPTPPTSPRPFPAPTASPSPFLVP